MRSETVPAARPTAGSVGRLHVLLDSFDRHRPIDLARAALAGGADVIQLRATHLPDRERFALACGLRSMCHGAGAQLIVDDRADIARAAGADGVHVGDHDLPVAAVRRVLGARAIVGATCRAAQAAVDRAAEGATYLGVGPAYATTTKDGLPDPLGPEGVGVVAAAAAVPVIAIGGVTADRAPDLVAAGVHGVAVAGAVGRAPDPGAATRSLAAAIGPRT